MAVEITRVGHVSGEYWRTKIFFLWGFSIYVCKRCFCSYKIYISPHLRVSLIMYKRLMCYKSVYGLFFKELFKSCFPFVCLFWYKRFPMFKNNSCFITKSSVLKTANKDPQRCIKIFWLILKLHSCPLYRPGRSINIL